MPVSPWWLDGNEGVELTGAGIEGGTCCGPDGRMLGGVTSTGILTGTGCDEGADSVRTNKNETTPPRNIIAITATAMMIAGDTDRRGAYGWPL